MHDHDPSIEKQESRNDRCHPCRISGIRQRQLSFIRFLVFPRKNKKKQLPFLFSTGDNSPAYLNGPIRSGSGDSPAQPEFSRPAALLIQRQASPLHPQRSKVEQNHRRLVSTLCLFSPFPSAHSLFSLFSRHHQQNFNDKPSIRRCSTHSPPTKSMQSTQIAHQNVINASRGFRANLCLFFLRKRGEKNGNAEPPCKVEKKGGTHAITVAINSSRVQFTRLLPTPPNGP